MVPYTDVQLTVVLFACVFIGMYFGALLVNIFKKKNNVRD